MVVWQMTLKYFVERLKMNEDLIIRAWICEECDKMSYPDEYKRAVSVGRWCKHRIYLVELIFKEECYA